jgi:hypothetical protein
MSIPTPRFNRGETVDLEAEYFDKNGAHSDPDQLSLEVVDPSDVKTTYVFGADGNFIRDSLGTFHRDITAATKGRWTWAFIGVTGTRTVVTDGVFFVDARTTD